MKRKISILLITIFICLIGLTSVNALEIKQESLEVKEKSSTISVIDDGIGDFEITPKIVFNELGDYITYRLVLKNIDDKLSTSYTKFIFCYRILRMSDVNVSVLPIKIILGIFIIRIYLYVILIVVNTFGLKINLNNISSKTRMSTKNAV